LIPLYTINNMFDV